MSKVTLVYYGYVIPKNKCIKKEKSLANPGESMPTCLPVASLSPLLRWATSGRRSKNLKHYHDYEAQAAAAHQGPLQRQEAALHAAIGILSYMDLGGGDDDPPVFKTTPHPKKNKNLAKGRVFSA
jgi:hypothetical protein